MLLIKKRTAPYSCFAFPNRSTTFLIEYILQCGCWVYGQTFFDFECKGSIKMRDRQEKQPRKSKKWSFFNFCQSDSLHIRQIRVP